LLLQRELAEMEFNPSLKTYNLLLPMKPRKKQETGHLPVDQLVTGYFRKSRSYSAWRTHGTDDWVLTYTIAGLGRYGYAGGELIARPHDIVLLRPRTLHDYGLEPTRRRWVFIWTHFHPRPAWVEWLRWPEVAPGLMRLTLHDSAARRRIVSRFWDAHELATGASRRRETLAMNALEEVLLRCDAENPLADNAVRLDPRVRTAMDVLCHRLSERIAPEALAEECGVSASRLAHLFKRQVGTTSQRFVEVQRLNRASQLLDTTQLSVKEIAAQVGFENPFYFTLRFKRHTGHSPRAYRNRRQSKPPRRRPGLPSTVLSM
jgi:AraC family transcriptional regulator of arabinose operon